MSDKTSKRSGRVAKKGAAEPVAAKGARPQKPAAKSRSGKVALLASGNPQIAKGYGDAPVQAYIAAMPGWKQGVGSSGLFNASLEGNTRRAIDVHEGDRIDERALIALVRAAVELNTSMRAAARPGRSKEREERRQTGEMTRPRRS